MACIPVFAVRRPEIRADCHRPAPIFWSVAIKRQFFPIVGVVLFVLVEVAFRWGVLAWSRTLAVCCRCSLDAVYWVFRFCWPGVAWDPASIVSVKFRGFHFGVVVFELGVAAVRAVCVVSDRRVAIAVRMEFDLRGCVTGELSSRTPDRFPVTGLREHGLA